MRLLLTFAALSLYAADRIVDVHVHYSAKNPHFFEDLARISERLHLSACVLTEYADRQAVADAARKYPGLVVPFGYVDLDASDALQQTEEFHRLGFRGLGELEFVKKPFVDPSYMPVYEAANRYGWVVLFHTGVVIRRKFDEPEDVAAWRMRAAYLEEIARRFPRLTVVGGHCGNPEYEWAAETARWNPNLFFDLAGTSLTKMQGRLSEFSRIFWWSGTHEGTRTPEDDPSAFTKLVFGSDAGWSTGELKYIEQSLERYRRLFEACRVPESAQKLILGRTLARKLELPE